MPVLAPDVSDDLDPLARPSWACVLHSPPRRVGAWIPADQGFVLCLTCDTGVRERLDDVGRRYLQLDPRPGGQGGYGSRGAPGFGSRPPLSLHVVALRDPRSSIDARAWVGGDRRVHFEQTRPPRSVHGTLSCQAWAIAEHRGMSGPGDRDDVFAIVRWISAHLSYAAKHAELVIDLDQALRDLQGQLRPVTGDPRQFIGPCPVDRRADLTPVCSCGHAAAQHDNDSVVARRCNVALCGCQGFTPVAEDAPESYACGAPLFAPLHDDIVRCPACGAKWERADWLDLGDLLQQAG